MDSQNSEQYKEAVDWLFSRLPMFSRIGAPAYKPGLKTTLSLDTLYNHPHRKFKAIHVAGTNGKGSTSHMLAAVLQAHGYKTGLYTSPHLTDFRERIRINGEMIPQHEVVDFVEGWKRRKPEDLNPSFFELTMMMAFDFFARQEVEYAVIEVGMGGRLDSTNIITPILSIITNISFDHTQFLGNTLKAIAVEKAGIIKRGVPVVIGEATGEVKDVFERKAAQEGASIIFAQDSKLSLHRESDGWEIEFHGNNITVPLPGSYQRHNIKTVVTSIEELRRIGIVIEDQAVRTGLENVTKLTGLRGRWQKMGENPLVICDTGHNVAGLSETMGALKNLFSGRTLRMVLGFVSDKDVDHIVDLFPLEGIYYFTRASIPRAMDEKKVTEIFASKAIRGKKYPTVKEAYAAAMEEAGSNDVVYIGGSTFIVADFLASEE